MPLRNPKENCRKIDAVKRLSRVEKKHLSFRVERRNRLHVINRIEVNFKYVSRWRRGTCHCHDFDGVIKVIVADKGITTQDLRTTYIVLNCVSLKEKICCVGNM